MSIFATKSIEQIKEEQLGEGSGGLKRVLGVWQLVMLGVGAIIGTGIFVLTGQAAAANAGPAIVISMVIAGLDERPGRALLLRVRGDGAGRGLRLHVRVRDARRVRRLGHRLGPDSRVRARRRDGRRRLVGQPRHAARISWVLRFPAALSAAPGTRRRRLPAATR